MGGCLSTSWKSGVLTEVSFEFTRSRGAGGQHVNRTESAVILRFPLLQSKVLTALQIERASQKLSSRLTNEGELILREEGSRDRRTNQQVLIKRFLEILEKSFYVPPTRRKTKPTKASQKKRVAEKKIHGEKKSLRGRVRREE